MAKARLLQAACAVALLAATPAFAQPTTTQPNMAPADKMDQTGGGMDSHSTHRSAMSGHSGMHARNDSSQNAAVDQLNDQSFQAAQRGQSFSGSDSGSSGVMSPASGSMNGMSGGSPVPAASGAGGGTGAK
jgi:hypothetical protein